MFPDNQEVDDDRLLREEATDIASEDSVKYRTAFDTIW
jgi:hypothetical protein